MSDLLQNHMSTSHTVRAHAQEVWDKSDENSGGFQLGRKVVTHNCKSDLPLGTYFCVYLNKNIILPLTII